MSTAQQANAMPFAAPTRKSEKGNYRDTVLINAGRTNTRLYELNPITGQIWRAEKVPEHAAGYTAMGWRQRDNTLWAMSGVDLLKIAMDTGAIESYRLAGVREEMKFDGEVSPDGNYFYVAGGNPALPVYRFNIGDDKPTLTLMKSSSGGGRWDDWCFNYKDGRMYAVEGDNGDLLYMDFDQNPMKQLLASNIFPTAERNSSGGRQSYAATFFDAAGTLYAIDSAGNAFSLDITKSTDSRPILGQDIRPAKPIGNGRVDVDDLEVLNAAGCVRPLTIKPSYESLEISQESLGNWSEWPDTTIYSIMLTVKNDDRITRKFRVSFDLPQGAEVTQAADLTTEYHEGSVVYLKSRISQVLPAHQTREIALQVRVPGRVAAGETYEELQHLSVQRLG